MKSNVNRGGGFRGILNYAMSDIKKHELISTNMSGETPRELAAEFAISRQLRPTIKKPVSQFILSMPKNENVSNEKWAEIVDDFLKEMKFDTDKNQFITVKHNDTELDHVHIIASRIGLNGELWHGRFEVLNAIEATQNLEKKHGLTITPGLVSDENEGEKKMPKKNEIEKALRTGEAPSRILLQNIIDEAIKNEPSVTAFIKKLEAAGVEVNANIASTGKLNGFSFSINNLHFKGSELGKAYGLKGLQNKGLTYDQATESAELIARKELASSAKNTDRSADSATNNRPVGEHVDISPRESVDGSNFSPSTERKYDRLRENDSSNNKANKAERGIIDRNGEKSGKIEQAQQLNEPVDGAISRLSDWRDTNNNVADIAATAHQRAFKNGSGAITKALKTKEQAWEKQASALNSPHYRLTLTGRREGLPTYNLGKNKDGEERFYSAKDVELLLPKLSSENARGYDIYITPIDKNNHYLVIDDMTEQTKKNLLADGFSPCLLQQSSADNFQAIIKIPKEINEQSQANTLVCDLNKKYGDPNFSGVIHPFRLAGFSNKKQGRDNAFTKIVDAVQRTCLKTVEAFKAIKQRLEKIEKMTVERYDRERLIVAASNVGAKASESSLDAFRRLYAKHIQAAQQRGDSADGSRLDWATVTDMLISGWQAEAVKLALKQASPDIFERHKNVDDYANRTVENALNRPEIKAAIKNKIRTESIEKEEPKTKKYDNNEQTLG